MPFQVHSQFQPIKLNPILENENLRSNYPSLQSLQDAYVIGREKHVIYSFEEDEDLPDLSTCIVPLSQESKAILANILSQDHSCPKASPELSIEISSVKLPVDERKDQLSSSESSIDELDHTFDQPDFELDIPGETVVSRTNSKSHHYWPARLLRYAGLKTRKRRFNKSNPAHPSLKTEKMYQLEFFDGTLEIVPRSHFCTTDQEEFYQVELGRIETQEVDFQEVIPQIHAQLNELDLIINGKSTDKEIKEKHDNFFMNQSSMKRKREMPQDVRYAKYGEELIHKMGQGLIQRYLPPHDQLDEESKTKIEVDERFEKLTSQEKSRYVFDILVPHLIWLITVSQYMETAEAELKSEASQNYSHGHDETTDQIQEEKISQRAKKLASIVIQEVDLVDKVTSLRVRKSSQFQNLNHSSQLNSSKQRQTYNSRKASQLFSP